MWLTKIKNFFSSFFRKETKHIVVEEQNKKLPDWIDQYYRKYSTDELELEEDIENSIEVINTIKQFKEEFLTCGIQEEEIYKLANMHMDRLVTNKRILDERILKNESKRRARRNNY